MQRKTNCVSQLLLITGATCVYMFNHWCHSCVNVCMCLIVNTAAVTLVAVLPSKFC